QRGEIARRTVRRESHDLVLVAVMREAEILRERLVEDAERMRKRHAAADIDVAAAPQPPGRGGEIARPVDRNANRFLERRHQERRSHMREVMLDMVELAAKTAARKAARDLLAERGPALAVTETVDDKTPVRTLAQRKCKLVGEVSLRIAVDRDMIDIRDA